MSRVDPLRNADYWMFMATSMEEGLRKERSVEAIQTGILLDAERFIDEALRGIAFTGPLSERLSFCMAFEAMCLERDDPPMRETIEKDLRAIRSTIERLQAKTSVSEGEREGTHEFFEKLTSVIKGYVRFLDSLF